MTEDKRKFYGQQCQDEELNKKFRKFHEDLVNEVIKFCKDNNITIDEFKLSADALEDSIKAGSWQSCTDSGFVFRKFTNEYKELFWEMDEAALSKGKEYMDEVEWSQEPFMFSM